MTMMLITPEKMPADPRPAIALPTINAFELGAAPQTVDYGEYQHVRLNGRC
jgi:hypothetical protein